MKIYIASDHGGFELKNKIKEMIKLEGILIEDMGPQELNPDDDYPEYAFPLAEKVAEENESLGILICRSGNGMSIAANKVKGAYSAVCFTKEHAKKAREDDGANVLCLDADYKDENIHFEIVKTFINTKFAGSNTRYERRLQEIKKYEENH